MKATPRPFNASHPAADPFLTHPNLQRLSSNEPADAKVKERGEVCFRPYSLSIAPMILSGATSAVFRSLNFPRLPLLITSLASVLDTALGFLLVFGLGPIPKFEVAGAGMATLISQSCRALVLIVCLHVSKKEARWVWPWPSTQFASTAGKLLRLTGPIAVSEVLWGMSTFIYAVVFTRLGTTALAASQIVLSLESALLSLLPVWDRRRWR
jgi:Na+-driven multidrug efflux pump